MDTKAVVDPLNLIIGIFLIGGGIAYFAGYPSLGGVIVAFVVALELLIKYLLGSR